MGITPAIEKKVEKAKGLIAEGLGITEAAKKSGVSHVTVRKYLKRKKPKLVALPAPEVTQRRVVVIVGSPADIAETLRSVL